jgi:hypothetical protein
MHDPPLGQAHSGAGVVRDQVDGRVLSRVGVDALVREPFESVVGADAIGLAAKHETIYFDLATLCEQARLPLEEVRAAAAARRPSTA